MCPQSSRTKLECGNYGEASPSKNQSCVSTRCNVADLKDTLPLLAEYLPRTSLCLHIPDLRFWGPLRSAPGLLFHLLSVSASNITNTKYLLVLRNCTQFCILPCYFPAKNYSSDRKHLSTVYLFTPMCQTLF